MMAVLPLHFFTNAHAQNIREVLTQRFEKYQSGAHQERVFIANDKDIYAPGEFIWVHATVYDALSTRLSENSKKVKIRLLNSEFSELLYKEVVVTDGHAEGFILLPGTMKDGLYYLAGNTDKSGRESYYLQKILIRNKIVPPFVIEVSFPDQRYLKGGQVAVNILFKDYYNEPLKNIPFQMDLFDGSQVVQSFSGKQKKEGSAVMIKIPENLKSGLLSYKIVADNKGNIAENVGVIPLMTNQLVVDFYPENGILTHGLPSVVSCFIYDVCGVPMKVEADIVSGNDVIATITTDENGFASFEITPSFDQKYYLQIQRPVLVEAGFALPDIRKQGFTLSVHEREGNILHYKIRNGYAGEKSVILVGVSENDIFSISEHRFERESIASIDISNAPGAIAYFVLINQDAEIEAEHIVLIKPVNTPPLSLSLAGASARPRSKVEMDINTQEVPGKLIIAAVNGAWKADQLRNQPITYLSLPIDFTYSIIMQHIAERGDADIGKYIAGYEPRLFGWDMVLNTRGTFSRHELPENVNLNRRMYDEICAQGLEYKTNGVISRTNLLSSSGFAAANPKYIFELYKVQIKSVPPYKAMIENGTPLMEVLKTIKPYNMYGNKIVFQGSANSLLAQDGALIIIDGISRGTDATMLNSLNPRDIERINISTNPSDIQRYTGLNSVGIIEIETKRGGEMSEEAHKMVSDDQQFESPDYEKKKDSKTVDWRSTLYWKIEQTESTARNISFSYFNADLITNVIGNAIFIPRSGSPQIATFEYEIK
jgi:hypothetical protein